MASNLSLPIELTLVEPPSSLFGLKNRECDKRLSDLESRTSGSGVMTSNGKFAISEHDDELVLDATDIGVNEDKIGAAECDGGGAQLFLLLFAEDGNRPTGST